MQEVNKNLRKWRKINHEKIRFVKCCIFLWEAYILLTIFVIEEDGSASLVPYPTIRYHHHHHYVDGVRLNLRIVATNRPIVHSPADI
jgi:hypothetical protein